MFYFSTTVLHPVHHRENLQNWLHVQDIQRKTFKIRQSNAKFQKELFDFVESAYLFTIKKREGPHRVYIGKNRKIDATNCPTKFEILSLRTKLANKRLACKN